MKRFFADFKKYYEYAVYSAKCSLNAEVAGSYLNWLWWIFNPFCMMIIYTVIFGYVFKAKEEYFPCFIFVGLTLWDYFNRTINASVRLIKSNKAIITKVYLPKFVLIVVQIMINFFKMLFSFGVIVVMLIVFRIPVSWNVLWMIPLLAVYTIFIFGICTVVMHFGVYVEDLENIVKIILRFLYYGVGVFWNLERRIPAPYNSYVIHGIPMSYFIHEARKVLIYKSPLSVKWLLIWLAISILICIFGIHKVYKYENSYAKVV